jgi:hypothetical protein
LIDWIGIFRGQLLPKKPELLNVFKNRRDEEKKRESERTREKSKLEQILARQRQKLDEVKKPKSEKFNSIFSFFRQIMFVQYPVMKVHIRMNLNSFIIEFVNNKINTNDDIYFFFICFMFFINKILLFFFLFF